MSILREENGYATVHVLGVTLVIAAVIGAYGLWVRFEAHSALRLKITEEARLNARAGLNRALMLLLSDHTEDFDWLGEDWGKGLCAGEGTVVILDEGSKLGLNWMNLPMWSALCGSHSQSVQRLQQERNERGGLISSVLEAKYLYPELALDEALVTVYSCFNLNSVDEGVLRALWRAAGALPLEAEVIAKSLRDRRADRPLDIKELESITHMSTELMQRVFPWIVFEGPINVNTASSPVLKVLFEANGLTDALYRRLIEARKGTPFRNLEEVERVLGIRLLDEQARPIGIGKWLTVRSTFFRISSSYGNPPVIIDAVVRRTWNGQTSCWEIQTVSWMEQGDRD
ncbi:MAG: type II secretion system protein GspK [Limnochordia bacterium]|nr:general secretion pathway protein GspK [Limnochordia bacterium]MDD2630464.1 type II secretion system protein GspK [Limnochordia bacterium]